MAGKIILKRGTTAQNNSYTGKPGELTYDITSKQLRLHNGSTAGGVIMMNNTALSPFLAKSESPANFGSVVTSAGIASYGTMPSDKTAVNVGQKSNVTFTVTNATASSVAVSIPYFTVDSAGRVTGAANKTFTISVPNLYSSASGCSFYTEYECDCNCSP